MADKNLAMGPYVVLLQDFWRVHELVEEPPSFRLALAATDEWTSGIWIEVGGWEHQGAAYLEGTVGDEWRCPSGFRWQRSFSRVIDPDDNSSIIGERENYAARWADDLIGFHISFFGPTSGDERGAARTLMSAMAGAAIVRRGPPPHDSP